MGEIYSKKTEKKVEGLSLAALKKSVEVMGARHCGRGY